MHTAVVVLLGSELHQKWCIAYYYKRSLSLFPRVVLGCGGSLRSRLLSPLQRRFEQRTLEAPLFPPWLVEGVFREKWGALGAQAGRCVFEAVGAQVATLAHGPDVVGNRAGRVTVAKVSDA